MKKFETFFDFTIKVLANALNFDRRSFCFLYFHTIGISNVMMSTIIICLDVKISSIHFTKVIKP